MKGYFANSCFGHGLNAPDENSIKTFFENRHSRMSLVELDYAADQAD